MASSAERLIRGAQCVHTNFRNADVGDSWWHRGVFIGCNFTAARLERGDFVSARVRQHRRPGWGRPARSQRAAGEGDPAAATRGAAAPPADREDVASRAVSDRDGLD